MEQAQAGKVHERLTLDSRLTDLVRVKPWVEALALQHAIGEETVYAIELCLEEALSNIVRHGYKGEPQHTIELSFQNNSGKTLKFAIDDFAPHFDQTGPGRRPSTEDVDYLLPGGHGMPLMKKFSSSVNWEATPRGNRLTLTFHAEQ